MLQKTYKSIQMFIKLEASSGIILFLMALFALILSNSSLAPYYFSLQHLQIHLALGQKDFEFSLLHLVNEGLMSIFFLLVGLEIKREMLKGELSSIKRSILPFAAALGGMLVPSMIFLIINRQHPENWPGFAIPMSTDIAFSLGIIALLGQRVQSSLKIFLTALAIIDDLGAILIIAFFYTQDVYWLSLGLAFLCFCLLSFLNYKQIYHSVTYLSLGFLLWFLILKSGVHATVAGVLLAMVVPLDLSSSKISPLKVWEQNCHPWVAFIILPLFAFLNTGIEMDNFRLIHLMEPITLGIILGLTIGKFIGIFCFSKLLVKLKWAHLPQNSNYNSFSGIAIVCGIGFTMSLFIANLAFDSSNTTILAAIKMGVFVGSGLSAVIAYVWLYSLAYNKK